LPRVGRCAGDGDGLYPDLGSLLEPLIGRLAAGTGTEGRQSVVYLDPVKGRPLYRALRTDAVAGYLAGAGGSVNQVDEVH
jgi:hypothetical protein